MDDSLITAYLLNGHGGGKLIGWSEIEQWKPEQGILWVHLNYTKDKAKQWLLKQSGLDPITSKAMLAEESRPRSLVNSEGVLLFLRGVNLNPGDDPEDMVSIRVWLNAHCIITTRKRRLLSIDDIRQSLDKNEGPKTTPEFLHMLNERLLYRISNVIEAIDDQVDQLEQAILTKESYLLRPKIADIRRQSIAIRRYLAPQREALSRLILEPCDLLSSLDKLYLREANDRLVKYIEDLDAARERAAVTQEELSSRLSEQMDKRMYLLSVVAVIFLPLTFLTGLLGINVEGIPGAKHEWAFLIVCSVLVGLLVLMFGFLRHKRWI